MPTQLHLFKQNFKFSAAHFLIFDADHAERLHGHNYQVRVDIGFAKGASQSGPGVDKGYLVDFNVFKKFIKQQLELWDEFVLLPAKHPEVRTKIKGSSLEVNFRDRYYVFPKNEVILLPVNNTSVENFSMLLAQKFFQEFSRYQVNSVRVRVEETRGQAASTLCQG